MTQLTVPADDLFGLHNLPYGVYSMPGQQPQTAVRYSEFVVDLAILLGDDTFAQPTLHDFMAQSPDRWVEVRSAITQALQGDVPDEAVHRVRAVRLHLRSRSPTTLTSTPPNTTPRTLAACSARTTRSR